MANLFLSDISDYVYTVIMSGYVLSLMLQLCLGWSGGAMVLGKLPMPGRPTYLD